MKRIHNCMAFALVAVSFISTQSLCSAETNRGIEFHGKGMELLGWVPYSPAPFSAIPPFALPNGELPLDFPATILNFDGKNEKKQFSLAIAADVRIDHKLLRLAARDAQNQVIPGVTFSVHSTPGAKQQLITFLGTIDGDRTDIKQLLILSMVQPQL